MNKARKRYFGKTYRVPQTQDLNIYEDSRIDIGVELC